MDVLNNVRIDDLSKLTNVEELRERLVEHFHAEPSHLRLFYRGKQVTSTSLLDTRIVPLQSLLILQG